MNARLSATAIAADVAAGRTSAVAVAQAALDRIAAYDAIQPQVWIARVAPEALIAAARAVDARVAAGEVLPLAGVPFAVKDNIDVAGMETTAACPAFAYRAERSATVVERLILWPLIISPLVMLLCLLQQVLEQSQLIQTLHL